MPLRSFAVAVLLMSSLIHSRAYAGETETRLPIDVVPTFESIHLNLDPSKVDYSGSVRITLRIPKPVDTIRFHAKEMDLKRVTLEGGAGTVALKAEPEVKGIVTVKAERAIPPGTYTLAIEFTNDFDRRAASLYRLEIGGRWYAFSQFEAVDARKAFPCWDEPSFKFPYQITVSIPKGQEAVSNTPIERDSTSGDVRTVAFETTKPFPSYLLAIAVGPLEFVPIPGLRIPGRVVVPKGSKDLAKTAVAMTPPLFNALERYFQIPYPYQKLDLIAVPEFSAGAMENPGAITYADRYLLFDEKTTSAAQRRTFAIFTAHEIAHMWFGDYVTMKWWDDLWLNESFAQWMGNKIADEVNPEYLIMLRAVMEVNGAFAVDAQLATHAIRRPVLSMDNLYEGADALAYDKGQSVLLMTERWIGPEVFRRGVISYLKAHAYGNAEGKDLWNALGRASGKDVPGVLASFLDQPGVPLVHTELQKDGTVTLSQRRFLNYGVRAPEPTHWKIPVKLLWVSKGKSRSMPVLLDRDRMTVRLPGPKPAWVHPNADEGGYYRWSVDDSSLAHLIAEAPTALTARERIGFIQNASALLESGSIHADQYLEILARFSGDSNPLVIVALTEAVGDVKHAFMTDGNEVAFGAYVRRVLGPAIRRFGLDRAYKEDEAISLVRPQLYAWLGDEGRDEEVLTHAEALAHAFHRDRGSVDPSLVSEVIRLSAIRGDSALFEDYRQRVERATVPSDRETYLNALGTFRDPRIRARALAYDLTGPLRPHEIFWIPEGIAQMPRQQDEVWAWWQNNYDALVKKMPPEYAMYVPAFAGGCSEPRIQKAKTFFADPKHQPPGTETTLAKVVEGTQDCLGLRAREGGAADRALSAIAEAK